MHRENRCHPVSLLMVLQPYFHSCHHRIYTREFLFIYEYIIQEISLENKVYASLFSMKTIQQSPIIIITLNHHARFVYHCYHNQYTAIYDHYPIWVLLFLENHVAFQILLYYYHQIIFH